MSTTGALAPRSAESVSETPWLDDAWVSPANIYGAGYASVTAASFDAGDQTYVLKAYNFDLSAIPNGSSIQGITVVVNAKYATALASIDLCQLLDVSREKVGTNLAATPQALTTSDANYTFGSSSNLWGNVLTAAWVKDADFGVAIGCIAGGTGNNNVDVYIDSVTLEVTYTAPIDLVINDNVHAHISDGDLALTQVYVLTVDANIHAHLSDNVAITQTHILEVAANVHSHISDSPAITQVHVLTVNDNIHLHLSDGDIIVEQQAAAIDLIINDNVHSHLSDNVTATQEHNLLINANIHEHLSDNVNIVQVHVLEINANIHQHISDGDIVVEQVEVLGAIDLIIQDNIHSQISDNVGITQAHVILIDDNIHSHISDNISITQTHILQINSNIHQHISDNVALMLIKMLIASVIINRSVSKSININREILKNVTLTRGKTEEVTI